MNKRVVSLAVAVALTVGANLTAQKVDPEIQKLGDQYQAAYNKGDAKALGALYTADAMRLTQTGQLLVGRAAIEKDYLAGLAGSGKGAKLTLHPGRTQTVSADVSLADGTFEVTGGTTTLKGHYLNTLVRQGGQWKLASVTTVADAPAK